MNETLLQARHGIGRKVAGQALVAKDGLSARYDLNRLQGVFDPQAKTLRVLDAEAAAPPPAVSPVPEATGVRPLRGPR